MANGTVRICAFVTEPGGRFHDSRCRLGTTTSRHGDFAPSKCALERCRDAENEKGREAALSGQSDGDERLSAGAP